MAIFIIGCLILRWFNNSSGKSELDISESVFQIWLNPSNFTHIHNINTWKGGYVTALVVKRIRRDLNVSHQMHVPAIHIPRRWSDYRGYSTPSFLRPGFVLSVPAGNFAPQLKIGETKSKLGQIRSVPSHYIDGNHYIALITLNTTVILKMGCTPQTGQALSFQPILK